MEGSPYASISFGHLENRSIFERVESVAPTMQSFDFRTTFEACEEGVGARSGTPVGNGVNEGRTQRRWMTALHAVTCWIFGGERPALERIGPGGARFGVGRGPIGRGEPNGAPNYTTFA